MTKIMLVFGTRPEAIKMCPVVRELQKRGCFDIRVCVTGQHRTMLKQVLDVFDLIPDYDLNIMSENQTLCEITQNILREIDGILREESPDIVLVHGDTSSTFAAALACFYQNIPVGHVEAGLRTYDMQSPYPEEFNRQSVGLIAKYHFAPTKEAAEKLYQERKPKENVYVTVNTAIDALRYTVKGKYHHSELDWVKKGEKLLLLTAHRRENLGEPMREMFRAIRRILDKYEDVKVIYPIHMNPKVREIANQILAGQERVHMIEPLNVIDFHNFMSASYMILTDSGGIQEEAPALHKPVLVMRDTTERPEGIKAGTLRLVGTKEENIYQAVCELLTDETVYQKMRDAENPYGDGRASERIADILETVFKKGN